MSDSQALLSVRDLSVSFRTRGGLIRAVDGVSFDVLPQQIFGIVGESGSGKSLTILSILNLIGDPNVIIAGSIRFAGQELVGAPAPVMRSIRGNKIAMIFQDPMTALTPVHTIGAQIIEQIRQHRQLSAAAAHQRMLDLLDAVGIPDPRQTFRRYPHELSGGQRQRAVIAMALSCDPALLLADEPTTALDVTVQAQILDLIRDLRIKFGSSIILITHNLGVVAEVADQVAVMYSGRIVEQANTADLFANPSHPYSWGLLGSMPVLDGPRKRLAAIPGLPPALDHRPPGCAFAPRCHFVRAACETTPPPLRAAPHPVACIIDEHERTSLRMEPLEQ
ncbi:MAG TPA: ABC transporter ATP-binding protein [Acidiphilium sp.]|nr:MAG: ABC transporter ATP-binding protein [Acidiphilium sp. 21-60-14]OYV89856.1 MAG: ABC transporter ATP-binding protein [Acidiphilium sp. 37-60-79]OZB39530.1 MAG: ABC transporter ATP-binding protein [Acidiphilium sp. 34-60-192]HQT89313.1 ABC transporter ATP-binding protein [Acidiphilium sp.]HQU24405.1 ABC transporter ATP-binding protein [Acidiphilium sp.]